LVSAKPIGAIGAQTPVATWVNSVLNNLLKY